MADFRIRSLGSSALPRITIGGVSVDPTDANVVILSAGGASGSYYTLRNPDNTQFQVGGAQTLTILGGIFYSNAANMNFSVGYADTATNNAAPTNPVERNASGTGSFNGDSITTSAIRDNTAELKFECPANKFPYVQGNGDQWVATIVGILS